MKTGRWSCCWEDIFLLLISLLFPSRKNHIQKVLELKRAGVRIIDPLLTFIDPGVTVKKNTIIHPGVHLLKETHIGENCVIWPYQVLINITTGDNCEIGRPIKSDSSLGNNVKLGETAEIRRCKIGNNVTSVHHSYLGDTIAEDGVNVGAGTITCNFDGSSDKKQTILKKGAFIGTNANLVAPIIIGEEAIIAAGSTITRDVPAHALAISRSREQIIFSDYWEKDPDNQKYWRRKSKK